MRLGNAPNYTLRRICRNTLRPQVARELPPPHTQSLFAKVQPSPVFTHRLHNQVDMRMGLISVQQQGIPVPQSELFSGKRAARFENACYRRSYRH